jgi:hypothetical protein
MESNGADLKALRLHCGSGGLPLGLGERRGDAAVSSYFIELARIGDLFPRDSLPHILELVSSCGGASACGDQKRSSVWLIHGGVLRSSRSAGEASTFFAVGELIQDIQKKVATEDAKREKYCD